MSDGRYVEERQGGVTVRVLTEPSAAWRSREAAATAKMEQEAARRREEAEGFVAALAQAVTLEQVKAVIQAKWQRDLSLANRATGRANV